MENTPKQKRALKLSEDTIERILEVRDKTFRNLENSCAYLVSLGYQAHQKMLQLIDAEQEKKYTEGGEYEDKN